MTANITADMTADITADMTAFFFIAPGGFEPPFCGPKPHVLPLDEGAVVLAGCDEKAIPALRPGQLSCSLVSRSVRCRESQSAAVSENHRTRRKRRTRIPRVVS